MIDAIALKKTTGAVALAVVQGMQYRVYPGMENKFREHLLDAQEPIPPWIDHSITDAQLVR